jgi:hypothetical protein
VLLSILAVVGVGVPCSTALFLAVVFDGVGKGLLKLGTTCCRVDVIHLRG